MSNEILPSGRMRRSRQALLGLLAIPLALLFAQDAMTFAYVVMPPGSAHPSGCYTLLEVILWYSVPGDLARAVQGLLLAPALGIGGVRLMVRANRGKKRRADY